MITIEVEPSDDIFFVTWRTSDEQIFESTKCYFRLFLPRNLARYDGGARAWCVDRAAGHPRLSEFIDFMSANYNARVEGWDDEAYIECAVGRLEAAYRSLHLQSDAPLEVVKAAFKALALIHHPDRPGGSTERMQKINTAYEEIMTARQTVRAA